jgi:hypothetical protein
VTDRGSLQQQHLTSASGERPSGGETEKPAADYGELDVPDVL